MPTDKPRFSLTLEPELLKQVDDFRFENRFPARSQAIIELVRMGLEAYNATSSLSGNNIGNNTTD